MPEGVRTLALTSAHVASPLRPDLLLRSVTPADTEELAGLYLGSYPPEIGAKNLAEARNEIESTFAGEFGQLRTDASLLAFSRGAPAGAILVTTESVWDADLPGPFVIDLFVIPAHRGRGVGRALVDGAIAACSAQSDRTLSLRVGEGTSPAAQRLYSNLGFSRPPESSVPEERRSS